MLIKLMVFGILVCLLGILIGLKNLMILLQTQFPQLKRKVEYIMAKVSELPGLLDAISAKVDEGTAEVVAEIQVLKDSLANQDLSPESQASFDRLTAKAEALANISPAVGGVEVPTA